MREMSIKATSCRDCILCVFDWNLKNSGCVYSGCNVEVYRANKTFHPNCPMISTEPHDVKEFYEE